MKLQVLGTGCPKCKQVYERACTAVQELGIDAEVVKVEDINEITRFGVMLTPALAIDGVVKIVGSVPDVATIKRLLGAP